MNSKELQQRNKRFTLDVVEFSNHLPHNRPGNVFANQLIRSSSSVSANYRAVCRARSDKEFISKLEIVIEEADETLFWLELIEESMILPRDYRFTFKSSNGEERTSDIELLKKEANELISIFIASAKTVKARLNIK